MRGVPGLIPDLIVRADAGSDLGLGHVVRSMALAQAWQDAGGAALLATTTRRDDLPASIELESTQVIPIAGRHPDPADVATVEQLILASPGAWVVCDGYHFDARYTRRLRRAGANVLVIDDQAEQPLYHADALLNQNLGAERLTYQFDTDPLSLLGPRFSLLPRAFARWRGRSPEIPDDPKCLLLTVGGSNEGGAIGKIVRACVHFLGRHSMRAVVLAGPGAVTTAWTEVARTVGGTRLEIVSNPSDIPSVMAAADIAVSSAGSTIWQLCFMGVPSVLMTVADNQKGIAQQLDAAGCAVDVGWHADLEESEFADTLERIFRDRATRARMSRKGQNLVDGRGVERVVAALSRSRKEAHEVV